MTDDKNSKRQYTVTVPIIGLNAKPGDIVELDDATAAIYLRVGAVAAMPPVKKQKTKETKL